VGSIHNTHRAGELTEGVCYWVGGRLDVTHAFVLHFKNGACYTPKVVSIHHNTIEMAQARV
jgi:hypothetical protein